jgi:putative hydrolase of HD superfamily
MKDSFEDSIQGIVNFIFEASVLQNMQRSGNVFLGSGKQTVGSHIFRTILIGFLLSKLANADTGKVMQMCLFHDIEETRTGDLNYLQQKYVKSDDRKALENAVDNLPSKDDILELVNEYEALKTIEAKLAKDADTLELLFYLKEELDKGNLQAENWINHAQKRLITDVAKKLLPGLKNTKYYDWWYNLSNEWDKGNKKW